MVKAINSNDELTFEAENNLFSVLSEDERNSYLGLNITGHTDEEVQMAPILTTVAASSRDYSRKISALKDQGSCGSCWTFAATAALEGEIYFKTSKTGVSLSEMEYMECSTTRDGCQGGWMKDCYSYSKSKDRIAPTSSYPYTPRDSRRCNAAGKQNALTQTKTRVVGNIDIRGDSQLLKYADKHIVSVAIKVVNSFQIYKSGVYNGGGCQSAANHAVGLVGFGSTGGKNY